MKDKIKTLNKIKSSCQCRKATTSLHKELVDKLDVMRQIIVANKDAKLVAKVFRQFLGNSTWDFLRQRENDGATEYTVDFSCSPEHPDRLVWHNCIAYVVDQWFDYVYANYDLESLACLLEGGDDD